MCGLKSCGQHVLGQYRAHWIQGTGWIHWICSSSPWVNGRGVEEYMDLPKTVSSHCIWRAYQQHAELGQTEYTYAALSQDMWICWSLLRKFHWNLNMCCGLLSVWEKQTESRVTFAFERVNQWSWICTICFYKFIYRSITILY